MCDAKIIKIYEGTNQVHRIVMARRLLQYPAKPPRPSALACANRAEVRGQVSVGSAHSAGTLGP